MQYQRHDLHYNFVTAVETDPIAAWDILINEINELVLDEPARLAQVIKAAEIRLPNKHTQKDLSDLTHDHIRENQKLRDGVLKLIADRHKDPHVNADGGEELHHNFDLSGVGAKLKGAAGKMQQRREARAESGEDEGGGGGRLIPGIITAAGKLVGNVKTKRSVQVEREKTKQMMIDSLQQKARQRNLPKPKNSSATKKPMSKEMQWGIGIGVSVVVLALIIGIARAARSN